MSFRWLKWILWSFRFYSRAVLIEEVLGSLVDVMDIFMWFLLFLHHELDHTWCEYIRSRLSHTSKHTEV